MEHEQATARGTVSQLGYGGMSKPNIVWLITEGAYRFVLPLYMPSTELEIFKSVVVRNASGGLPVLLGAGFSCTPYGFRWEVIRPTKKQLASVVGDVRHACDGYKDWVESLPVGLPRTQATTGTGQLALMCFDLFQSWAKAKRAQQAIEMLEAREVDLDWLRTWQPGVFEVAEFKDYLSQRIATNTLPKPKRGKRRNAERNTMKRELYLLACKIEREEQPITWIAACAAACERQPALVPPTWIECPAENLRREADAFYNKTRWGSYRARAMSLILHDERPDVYSMNYFL